MKKSLFKRALIFLIVPCMLAIYGCMPAAWAESSDSDVEPSAPAESMQVADTVEELQPGMVRGKVLLDNGAMVACGIIVEDESGNTYRTTTNALGGYNLRLQPGSYKLHFTRGTEYSIVSEEVTVESYKVVYLQDVRLVHLFNTFERGWVAGGLHQHTFYSDGADGVYDQLLSNISVGQHYGFLSDHNVARGLAEWTQGNYMVANMDTQGNPQLFHAYDAVEVTTEFGHYQSLGIGLTFDTYEVLLRDAERSKTGEEKDQIIKDKIIYIADTIRREGGIPQINHPYSSNTMGFNYWEIADHFDTIEIWNGVFPPGDGRYEPEKESEQGQNYRSKLKWYELLNEVKNGGKFLAATGGTDNHDSTSPYTNTQEIGEIASMEDYEKLCEKSGKYSGVPTTYVNIRGEFNQENLLKGIQAGHSFISNGVVVLADVDGMTYGDTVKLTGDAAKLNVEAFCREGLEKIQVVKNGNVLQEINCNDETNFNQTLDLTGMAPGDWITLEVFGEGCFYAITNPIFFQ